MATKYEESKSRRQKPTHDEIHKDISLGNNYRLESSKFLLAISSGILAFTVSFPPAIDPSTDVSILKYGWLALSVSIMGGIGNLYGWERFYLSYRDYDWKEEFKAGDRYRIIVNRVRRVFRLSQILGLIAGALSIGFFASANIQYSAKSDPQIQNQISITEPELQTDN